MNPKPIENARDADLRLSVAALERAARRARDVAAQTGTAIVISRKGVLQFIRPPAMGVPSTPAAHEPAAPYDDKQ